MCTCVVVVVFARLFVSQMSSHFVSPNQGSLLFLIKVYLIIIASMFSCYFYF